MKAHVVHAHPEPHSFVAAMRDAAVETLTGKGYEVTVTDLYATGFDPVLSAQDFTERADPDYLVPALEQRHGHRNGTLAPEIAGEIDRVTAADLLVLSFPVYWFSMPAMMKGWIDRVFVSGAFYGGRRVYGAGGMAGKRALALTSVGGREHMFGPGSIHGELEAGMLRHLMQGSLGYVGFDVAQPFVAHHVPYVAAEERAAILDAVRAHVAQVETLPILPLPDLTAFDETFAPK